MKKYKVKKGFMAYQFTGKPTYAIGIEVGALKAAGEYRCTVGEEGKEFTVTYQKATELINKYGYSKVVRIIRKKNVFIIPIFEIENDKDLSVDYVEKIDPHKDNLILC